MSNSLRPETKSLPLTSSQKRHLRGLAHHLEPLVSTGRLGYTNAIVGELDRCLGDHELVKMRIAVDEREEFSEQATQLAEATGAALVQTIGRIALFYRPASEPVIQLPGAKTKKAAAK